MTHYDVIVLGAGGMGSAAAYHVARRGRRVLAIEQFSLGHEFGSSHGITRIIRLAYAEHPAYVPLLRRAYQLWREMEQVADETLLLTTGGLDIGQRNSAMVEGSLQSCAVHSIVHHLLTAEEIAARWPGYRLARDMVAVYHAEGGFVLPERSIVAHITAAQLLGAEVHGCERVESWIPTSNGVVVRTDRDTYSASRLIIAAGAWAARTLPFLQTAAVPERQVMIWTQPIRPDIFTPDRFPIFNMESEQGRFYGFPIYGVPGFKIGKYHHRGEQVDPDTMNRDCESEDEAVLREGIASYFPEANGPTLAMKTCMFTNSPDEHFLLDLHPDYPQVSIAAGFSGHGFKFATVIGEILADFALDGGCARWDLALFRLARLNSI